MGNEERCYVNVYQITRHFGGHEEGGWWYDWWECLECVPTRWEKSEEIQEMLYEEYKGEKYGDISSVLGGVDILVAVEEERCMSESKEVPIYE